nr:hypothetical protein 1 [Desulfobacteraceae bacterium]
MDSIRNLEKRFGEPLFVRDPRWNPRAYLHVDGIFRRDVYGMFHHGDGRKRYIKLRNGADLSVFEIHQEDGTYYSDRRKKAL